MAHERSPYQIIQDNVTARQSRTDDEVLAELAALPPLADEGDRCWGEDEYWQGVVYPYLALTDIAAARRLRPAIRLLLDRACYGDPGEIMRGLRHCLEAIVNTKWSELTEICLEAVQSPRLGTRLWAIDELIVLDDTRAEPIFRERCGPHPRRFVRGQRLGQATGQSAERSRLTRLKGSLLCQWKCRNWMSYSGRCWAFA